MSINTRKAALAIGLVILAAMDVLSSNRDPLYRTPGITLGVMAFGLFNVLVAPRGTLVVRTVAIGLSFLALATDRTANAPLLLLMWLVWPPIFLMAWALGRDDDPDEDFTPGRSYATSARVTTSAIIVMTAAGAAVFRTLVATSLQQSGALFIGVPAVLAIAAVFSPTPRSAVGVACKAVTIGLLVSMMFLGEGMLCVLMSAPLFYLVAVVVGISTDRLRAKAGDPSRILMSSVLLLALAPMSLEGVTAFTSFNRENSVSETKIVHASADAVAAAIRQTPRFDRALPFYLRAGFPRPTSTAIVGHRFGGADTRWVIRMRGGEMRLNGMEPRAGDLVLALENERPGSIEWRALSDDSHMTHFLDWRGARVEWQAIDASATRVTWTLRYHRRLDPAWYFGPMEDYATHLAAGYLIDAVATP